jgi:PAS domain S-box-containing protein
MAERKEFDFRSIAEHAPSIIIRFDKALRHVYVNPAIEAKLGLPPEQMIGKTHQELGFPKEITEYWTGALRRVMKSKKAETLEFEFPTPKGEVFYRSRLVPEFDARGDVETVLVIADDITDLKQLEESLRRSEARYRQFFDENLSGNFVSTPDGRLLMCNPAFARMFGYDSVEEALAASADSYYERSADRERYLMLLREKRKLENFPEVLRRRDGTPIHVISNIRGEFDKRGELIQIHGYILDETSRVMAEERIRQSMEQFQQLFEEAPIGMALISTDLTLIRANAALCQMLGYAESELKDQTIASVTHPDDLYEDQQQAIKLINGKIRSYKIEKRYIKKTGEIVWGLLTASVIRDKEGRILYGLGMVEDITERKRAQEALRASEERYREFLRQSTEGMWRYELEKPIPIDLPEDEQIELFYRYAYLAECNDVLAKMYGYERAADLIGARLNDTLVRDDPNNLAYFRTFIRSNYRIADAESREPDRAGNLHVFLNNFVGIIEHGKLVRVWGSQRDVTQQKLFHERLRESEEKYRSLFEESKDVIFISTPEGRFLDINQAGVELFGYASREELLSADIARDLYVDARDRHHVMRILAERGFIKDFEVRSKRKDGRSIIILETTTAVRNAQGEVVAYRGILRDVTEQRALEEQLRQAQKMESVGTLAGGMAHDFNNILSIILGYLNAIEHPDATPEQRTKHIEAIRRAVERGASIIRQLLTFARKQGGEIMPIDVNAVITDLSTLLQETLPKSIRLELKLTCPNAIVRADENQFQQAVLNLCLNAKDAILATGRDHGALQIETERVDARDIEHRFPNLESKEYVRISVKDTGVGMDEHARQRMFEPFFTTKPPGKGTGLGLAVVYGAVRAHKGCVDVESEPGKGTNVMLYLPLDSQEHSNEPDKEHRPRDRMPGVLLVEDEEMLLDLLSTLLEDHGFRAFRARDGEEAVKLYAEHQHEIAVVLSDMGLPKLGGWEAFQKMKEINPNVKSILASGYLDPKLREEMIRAGAIDFIQKPYVPEVILKRISDIIEKKRS